MKTQKIMFLIAMTFGVLDYSVGIDKGGGDGDPKLDSTILVCDTCGGGVGVINNDKIILEIADAGNSNLKEAITSKDMLNDSVVSI